MKKTLLILLAACYLMSSSGLVVCVGKCRAFFQSVAVGSAHPQGCCGQKDSHQTSARGCQKGCCKDTKCMLKLQTSQQLSTKYEWNAKLLSAAVSMHDEPFVYQAPLPSYRVLIIPDYHAPPSHPKNPLYLHYRVLLI